MPEDAIMVFTGRPPQQILEEGGTQAWALNPRRARKCEYVVCVQNQSTLERFSPTEPHDQAFLIGKITEVALSEEQPTDPDAKPARYIIKFREFERIAIDASTVRDKNRNPVSYIDLASLGINKLSLKLSRSREDTPRALGEPIPVAHSLTIAEAKAGLAQTFGVSEDSIEITIRG